MDVIPLKIIFVTAVSDLLNTQSYLLVVVFLHMILKMLEYTSAPYTWVTLVVSSAA